MPRLFQLIALGALIGSFAPRALALSIEGNDVRTQSAVSLPLEGGKPTVVVFMSSRCPCSASHEPPIEKLANTFKEMQFVGIVSNQDETPDELREHFTRFPLSFPILRDNRLQYADHFRALKTPHVFVLDKKGKTLYQGGVDDSHEAASANKHYLKDALTEIQAGRAPKHASVRVLGCAIRR